MANLDAIGVGDKAVRLGLITQRQFDEAWEDAGKPTAPEPLLQALERKAYVTPWQSAKLIKDHNDGYFLGGYRILYKVASGSFGRVYRADDPSTGRVVAIKILRSRHLDNKDAGEQFVREGKIGMTFQHPNIVEVLAVNQDPLTKQYFIVMEFVEGGTLREILDIRKKLGVKEALRIIEDCASGLGYAFSRGVTHRDIKLTNVLVSSQGQAKLVDFGLAGAYGPGQSQDQMDRTVDYAGLERNTGVAQGDTRSDIFFLGCVAYEILTGRPPLSVTRDPKERMSKERFTRIAPMKREEVEAPPSVFRLVETMMALNPTFRFQTPQQLVSAIKASRRELHDVPANATPGADAAKSTRTIFITEQDERLQDVLRDKFKERGFRVMLAKTPERALERFRTQPFDVLVVNAATTGEVGIHVFERIMREAEQQQIRCVGVLMLDENQREWQSKLTSGPGMAILVHPVRLKQLESQVAELLRRKAVAHS